MERAQTIGQLVVEVQRSGATAADLARLRDAYLMSMQLYSSSFSGSGKSAVAHELGTASIARRHGAPIDLTVAAMLHGAYLIGDWGHWRLRITNRKRAELRAAIGERSEAYIYAYTSMTWDAEQIPRLAQNVHALSAFERDLLMIRLTEELDRQLDCGAILCFRQVEPMRRWLRGQRDHLCRIARDLGHPALSDELGAAIDVTLAADVPAEFRDLVFPGAADFRVIPRSYRKRLSLRTYQWAAGYARRLERALRSRVTREPAGSRQLAELRRP